jgi:hypothetical protein
MLTREQLGPAKKDVKFQAKGKAHFPGLEIWCFLGLAGSSGKQQYE